MPGRVALGSAAAPTVQAVADAAGQERQRRHATFNEARAAMAADGASKLDRLQRKKLAETVRRRRRLEAAAAAASSAAHFGDGGLVVGINACTRALEQGRLAMLLVARDLQPAMVTQVRGGGPAEGVTPLRAAAHEDAPSVLGGSPSAPALAVLPEPRLAAAAQRRHRGIAGGLAHEARRRRGHRGMGRGFTRRRGRIAWPDLS